MLKINNILDVFDEGINKPLLATDNKSNLYVLKAYNDNNPSHKVEFNELISYRFAKTLNLPIPECHLAYLSRDCIINCNNSKVLQLNYSPGICFAMEYHKGITNIDPVILKNISNMYDIPGIFLFDELLLNDDRYDNPGNLLYDKKTSELMIIDHSQIFRLGSIWNADELEKMITTPPTLIKLHGNNYNYLKYYVYGNSPFARIIKQINLLNPSEIDNLFIDIPDEWLIDNSDVEEAKELLKYQVFHFDDILKEIKKYFPSWKGSV